MSLPLGIHAFLRLRDSSQRTAVLNAVTAMLDKGGNEIILREDLCWSDVQATEGAAYDWTIPDGIMTAAADAGCRILWVLNKPPAWATAPGGTTADSWRCPPFSWLQTQGGNSALAAYAAFCSAAAIRYGNNGDFWLTYVGTALPTQIFEILNEEYTTLSANGYVSGSVAPLYSNPAAYAEIYNAAAAALHAIPGIQVAASLSDRIWNSSPAGGPYLDVFLKSVTQRIDIASLHPYTIGYASASFVPAAANDRWQYYTQVADVRAKLDAAHFHGTRIWVTELGWPSKPGSLTEAQQAARWSDLWTKVAADDNIHGLILFNATNPDFPDNPALSGYAETDQETYYALWHTGATHYDLGSAKPAVATITGLPAIDYEDKTTLYFISPTETGDLPTSVRVSEGALPANSVKRPLRMRMNPIARDMYPPGDLVSYYVDATPPAYLDQKSFNYNAVPAKFRYSGILSELSGFGVNKINGAGTDTVAGGWTPYSVETVVQGTDVAFSIFATSNSDYKVLVDGMALRPGWDHFTTGGAYALHLKFATSDTRTIKILLGPNAFQGAWIPGAGDIWATQYSPFRMAMIGDSYLIGSAAGTEGVIMAGSISGELVLRTGWEIWNFGQASTGYSNPGNGTTTSPGPNGTDYYAAPSRVNALSAVPTPDLAYICGGANDINFTTYPLNTTISRANSIWSAIGRAWPGVPLVVEGVQSGVFKSSDAALNTLNNALRSAAERHPNVLAYIDQRNPMWVDGTGRLGATTGDGNADLYVSSAGTFPGHAGWAYRADMIVNALSGLRV